MFLVPHTSTSHVLCLLASMLHIPRPHLPIHQLLASTPRLLPGSNFTPSRTSSNLAYDGLISTSTACNTSDATDLS